MSHVIRRNQTGGQRSGEEQEVSGNIKRWRQRIRNKGRNKK